MRSRPFAPSDRLVRSLRAGLGAVALALVLAAGAQARDDSMTPMPVPAQPNAIVLDTGPLPGATAPETWHRQYNSASPATSPSRR